jgi:hypothetical protein
LTPGLSRFTPNSYMLTGKHVGEASMVFHDDASSQEVAKETAQTIREAARMIGKADRGIHDADIQELQLAMMDLTRVLDFKASINANRT